jgi:hypothetical protein
MAESDQGEEQKDDEGAQPVNSPSDHGGEPMNETVSEES